MHSTDFQNQIHTIIQHFNMHFKFPTKSQPTSTRLQLAPPITSLLTFLSQSSLTYHSLNRSNSFIHSSANQRLPCLSGRLPSSNKQQNVTMTGWGREGSKEVGRRRGGRQGGREEEGGGGRGKGSTSCGNYNHWVFDFGEASCHPFDLQIGYMILHYRKDCSFEI